MLRTSGRDVVALPCLRASEWRDRFRLSRATARAAAATTGGGMTRVTFPGSEAAMRQIMSPLCASSLAAALAVAQDPVKVDATHYNVELENAPVRGARTKYGPHDTS